MADKVEKNFASDITDLASTGYDDAYGEGFTDGRKSMAVSILKKLIPLYSDSELSDITGLSTTDIAEIRSPEPQEDPSGSDAQPASQETPSAPFSILRENPAYGTTFVEPSFVRLVRAVHGLTQARLAKKLGVHERTVCAWETTDTPIRIKTATYELLLAISNPKNKDPEELTQADL